MKVEFILTATGSVVLPRVDHCIFATDAERAKSEGVRVVNALSKAGYFNFDLYDVREETHVRVCSFSVTTFEPKVEIK